MLPDLFTNLFGKGRDPIHKRIAHIGPFWMLVVGSFPKIVELEFQFASECGIEMDVRYFKPNEFPFANLELKEHISANTLTSITSRLEPILHKR